MSAIGFNVNVNTNTGLVEVFNETPATGTAATGAADAKPTLTQVQSEALGSILQSFMETAVKLAPPGSNTQANALALAQTALEGLQELAPGFGVTAEAIAELSVTLTFANAVADLAATPGADPKVVAEMAAQLETQAGNLMQALQDLITNSTYPNFTDMLKELMALAQEIKEGASKVKMGAIEGKYDLQMAGVAELRTAATEDKAARDANIKADVTAAWTGVAFAVAGAAFARVGASSSLIMGTATQQATATAMSTVGNSMGGLGQSLGTLATQSMRQDASDATGRADEARANRAEYDAMSTKQDASIQVASEIEEAVKKLRDAAMQMLGTFISNHVAVIRTSTEV